MGFTVGFGLEFLVGLCVVGLGVPVVWWFVGLEDGADVGCPAGADEGFGLVGFALGVEVVGWVVVVGLLIRVLVHWKLRPLNVE